AAVVGLPLLPTTVMSEDTYPVGVLRFFRVAALDDRATEGLLWPLFGPHYSKIGIKGNPDCRTGMSHSLVPEYSEIADAYQVCTLLQNVRRVPGGQAVPVSVDNAFSKLADTVSQKWFLANCAIPAVRAIRIWKGWLEDPLPYGTSRRIPVMRRSFILYYLLVD